MRACEEAHQNRNAPGCDLSKSSALGSRVALSHDFTSFRNGRGGAGKHGMSVASASDSSKSQPLTGISRSTFPTSHGKSANSMTSIAVPRIPPSASVPTSNGSVQQGMRELTYNADYQPERFDTPLCQYRRFGPLLNGKGHMVAGGMNKGIFVIERRDNKQKLIEKRLPINRQSQRRRSRAEIDALTRLLHAGPCDNINKIHESFFPGMTDYSCVILSFCELGSITDYINYKIAHSLVTPEPFAWHVLESIMRALTFCHYGILADSPQTDRPTAWMTLCHLDVKPDNIWLTQQATSSAMPRIVLGDFGCSVSPTDIDRGLAHALMLTHGTPRWLPAEAKTFSHDGRGRYGKATDIWQAGAIVQTMCRLTKSPDPQLAAARRPCGSTHFSRGLNSIVASCMEAEAGKRPSAIDCWEWVKENGPARGLGR